jgi:glycosyltransferase involved in cell wall biosynthesis
MSTKITWNYDKFNDETHSTLNTDIFLKTNRVSILIPSYNTKILFIKECLDSIKNQIGDINIEIVWVDDGSTQENSEQLITALNEIEQNNLYITVKYIKNDINMGIGYSLHKGLLNCSNEIVMRMDSDDIMVSNRVIKQYDYMISNPDVHIIGTQMYLMKSTGSSSLEITKLKSLTLDEYIKQPKYWIISHPSVCFKKSSVLSVGQYNTEIKMLYEDIDLWLRMLNKYKYIHIIDEPLVYYRTHCDQVTYKCKNDDFRTVIVKLIKQHIDVKINEYSLN